MNVQAQGNIDTLRTGTYRLSVTVKNPKPDRRVNQIRMSTWHQWTKWPKGMLFIIEPDPQFKGHTRIYARDGYKMNAVADVLTWHKAQFDALTSALEPISESPSDLIIREHDSAAGRYALTILDKLNLPLAEVSRLLAEIEAEDEAAEPREAE